jgi:hypothetical protein
MIWVIKVTKKKRLIYGQLEKKKETTKNARLKNHIEGR